MRELSEDLELVGKKIAFEFLEDQSSNGFSNRTRGGIYYREETENQLDKGRWGRVLLIGPDVKEVSCGDYVLVEPLRWTTGLTVGESEEKFWMTEEKDIMAISDGYPEI